MLEEAEKLGLVTIQWDVDSLDWKGLSAQAIAERVLGSVKNGSIVLMHNNADNIVPALKLILIRLKQLGYKVGSVGELVYKENYTIIELLFFVWYTQVRNSRFLIREKIWESLGILLRKL
ncbi:hypothetical protein [Acholeplasma equifetale]|uniref:hypothetical protein n=1 Tax=Acholeplasma equifetale TaxID=264634 RepID=UPI0012EBD7F6|nr:hypothetical protein [Acholeplasma equifetale]